MGLPVINPKYRELTRLEVLALPKPINCNFIEDRRTVYWTDGPLRVAGKNKLTPRQKMLANHKFAHKDPRLDRPSPIWMVSRNAMRARVSERVRGLACAKKPHID